MTIADYKQRLLIQQGREQFKTLLEKGLGVTVALLYEKGQLARI